MSLCVILWAPVKTDDGMKKSQGRSRCPKSGDGGGVGREVGVMAIGDPGEGDEDEATKNVSTSIADEAAKKPGVGVMACGDPEDEDAATKNDSPGIADEAVKKPEVMVADFVERRIRVRECGRWK